MDAIAVERYSAALFASAQDNKAVSEVLEDLNSLEKHFESTGLKEFLCNPKYPLVQKRQVINALGESFASKLTSNFINLLLKKSRIDILLGVGDTYRKLETESRGIVACEIKLRDTPSGDFLKKIEDSLKRMTHHEIDLSIVVDQRLIGGAVIKIGNRVLDASIRSRVKEIKKQLLATKIN
ncbi:MAG: F-type H+-transporting ATPase subunit delta [Candidatus Omnitrophota bacterium]